MPPPETPGISFHTASGVAHAPTSRRTEADELRPGRDHYVYVGGKCEAILLPSFFPTEFSLLRARRAFVKANPHRKVVVRVSRPPRS